MKKFKFKPESLFYLITSYLCSLLLAYFLEEFVRLSALFDLKFFAERINADDPLVWDITYEICFLIAYVIFDIVFSIAYKSRRKEFIKDTSDEVYREDLIRNKMIENVPVIITSYAPNSLASGSKIAVGGNFKDYAVALAGQLDITPKKQAGSLKTIFDVNCYMAGCPTVANNFFVLETK